MEFRIADTFTDSLAKLQGQEQKAVKTTAFDLQLNPANPGMQFHRLDKSRDANFWSIRVNRDIRIIVHKTEASLLLCYVDHHDKAYQWAQRRKIERHPRTGAAQLVEVRETVEEIAVPKYVEVEQRRLTKPALFSNIAEEKLLEYGVPPDWLADVKAVTEDSLFDLAEHLPREAAESLLDLATGVTPAVPDATPPEADPFEHPDAKRRFRVMTNAEELAQALEYPWEKWAVFLHPGQRELVEKDYNGPARVAGSAGTGKTVVALHRAAYLAKRNSDARVLVTTFNDTLADALRVKLRQLLGNQPGVLERVEVFSIPELAKRLYAARFGAPEIADDAEIRAILAEAAVLGESAKFSEQFVFSEWRDVVDAWQLNSWESYRDVPRLGRKTRLPEKQRAQLWKTFQFARDKLEERKLVTQAAVFSRLAAHFSANGIRPYDFAVVDEAQDLGVPEITFLAALGADKPNGLFFAGDLGQRIFQTPFSWKSLGIDIRGRSKTLRINYRTSHQIRAQADRLLPGELSDVDGITESRRGAISVFNGPPPEIRLCKSEKQEAETVATWLKAIVADGIGAKEIGLFVRSEAEFPRAVAAVKAAALDAVELSRILESNRNAVSVMTMHLAKGLEFRAVVIMACDDDILPLRGRITEIGDEADLEEVYTTERHLLYVACTRARDRLLVTGVEPGSDFLEDLG